MAPRRKRQRKKKKTQQGGAAPFFVDFKKGVNVTKDLIKALKKPVNVPQAKAQVKSYKQQYQDCKRRGGSKSLGSWAIDKEYAAKNSGCCIM